MMKDALFKSVLLRMRRQSLAIDNEEQQKCAISTPIAPQVRPMEKWGSNHQTKKNRNHLS
jgi:hypothetical protein